MHGTSSQEVVAEVIEGSVVGGVVADGLSEVKLRLLISDSWETAQVVMGGDMVWSKSGRDGEIERKTVEPLHKDTPELRRPL